MTISYKWLSEYLPETIAPEKLSKILTAIGLEVEAMEAYTSIKGGLDGLVVGEVLTCADHENSDHLHVTTVNIGQEEPLQIVCGAPNVAAGQKVVVAAVGTTIYPTEGEPLTMKKAKIRGVESYGMLCGEDEIGLGKSHEGIVVLDGQLQPGKPLAEVFNVYTDTLFEIGLTPNRMDAMSHIGVARDVCAYLSRSNSKEVKYKAPSVNNFHSDNESLPFKVTIENENDCQRYTGISISNVTIAPSPDWIQDRLKAVGIRPINNIVDITNYVLQEFGQPLHAYDADKVAGHHIIVKNLPENTPFTTLDGKERKLKAMDLMVCDEEKGLCIAGVFGGQDSGVSDSTASIFLESAFFAQTTIRRTSVVHGLRTDAATHFEKGVDIAAVPTALKRAAKLIKEIAGGEITSSLIDSYPHPKEKTTICLKNHYLKKLSGKNYHPDSVKRILTGLGFELVKEGMDELWVAVPYSKPDITLPADVVEEIVRIDGLDNIEIPASIHITPEVDGLRTKLDIQEKVANYLVGQGFYEILTNSITNSAYYDEDTLEYTVTMLNSLSADLNVMRPSMLETGLEVISYNIKRKATNLQLFELGKSYRTDGVGKYSEKEHLAIYITGNDHEHDWQGKGKEYGFFRAKGIASALVALNGLNGLRFAPLEKGNGLALSINKKEIGTIEIVPDGTLKQFDIKVPVYFIDIDILALIRLVEKETITYAEIPKFPSVSRDLALIVDSKTPYESIENVVRKSNLPRLENIRLFDIFENEKLGKDKKSVAVNFTFQDAEKTLTDKEIDQMVNRLVTGLEKELGAEIRK